MPSNIVFAKANSVLGDIYIHIHDMSVRPGRVFLARNDQRRFESMNIRGKIHGDASKANKPKRNNSTKHERQGNTHE